MEMSTGTALSQNEAPFELSESFAGSIHNLDSDRRSTASIGSRAISALPPVDGTAAYTFLGAAFVLEMLGWGYGLSVGVFHEYWGSILFPEASAAAQLTVAATLQTGLTYAMCIVAGPISARFRAQRVYLQYIGLFAAVLGIMLAGFAKKPWHLILTAGIIYPAGATVMWMPIATLTFEWFAKKRGLATGILFAGTGVGGAIFPIIMQTLLDKFSYKAASISLALGYGLVGGLAIPFIKERIPVNQNRRHDQELQKPISWDFFKNSSFYSFLVGGAIFSLGSSLPNIYIPSYAVDLGLSKTRGSALVTIINASSIIGRLMVGAMSDRYSLRATTFVSAFGGAIACFFLFGFATSMTTLVAFSVLWGLTASGFTSIVTRAITLVAKDDPNTPTILFSIFFFTYGAGMIASGPIASALLSINNLGGARFGYGLENYGPLILWTGCVAALGSVVTATYRTV